MSFFKPAFILHWREIAQFLVRQGRIEIFPSSDSKISFNVNIFAGFARMYPPNLPRMAFIIPDF